MSNVDRSQLVVQNLSELANEIDLITKKQLVDEKHIQYLFGTFLPKFMKTMLTKKQSECEPNLNRYYIVDSEMQIQVTQFINYWMTLRVPKLGEYFINSGKEKENDNDRDPVHRIVGLAKEFEILEMIFDDNLEIYNFKLSKNNPEIEVRYSIFIYHNQDRLSKMLEILDQQNKTESQTEQEDINTFQDFKIDVAIVKKPQTTSFYYVHNINVFARSKGFDQFLMLLTTSNNQADSIKHKSTFKLIMSILNILLSMRQFFRDQFWQDYAIQIKDICMDFIYNRCTSEDLRNTSKKELSYFASHIESILDSVVTNNEEKTERVYQISESLDLELALRCLQMPILEKKLIGHSILAQKINQCRINRQQQSSLQQSRNLQLNIQSVTKRWLNKEKLIEWMEEKKIFDLVFGDSLHSEVIKKSYTFLQFLYQNGKITLRELDKMWDCATKKHEAYKVAILKALTFLTALASQEHLQYLFQKIKSLPWTEVDKFSLGLVRQIAKKVSGDENHPDDLAGNVQGRSNSLQRGNQNNKSKFKKNNVLDFEFDNRKDKHDFGIIGSYAQDDMSRPLTIQNQQKGKKTRSLSQGDESDVKKGASSLINKISDSKSNVKENLIERNEVQQNNQEEEKQENQQQQQQQQEINPLEVPADKEDKNTADEEGSFGNKEEGILDMGNSGQDPFSHLFDNSNQNNQQNQQPARKEKVKQFDQDMEEEKADGSKGLMIQSLQELIEDETLGIDNNEKRELAKNILDYLWTLCMEETVISYQLPIQSHKLAIDQFAQTIIYNYPITIMANIAKCVNKIHQNQSVMSVQTILQKLIMNASYPLAKNKNLPKNRQELIQVLDEELNLTNECLSSYIEFKRGSLTLIFDQIGSQEQEQENLETQSSLDNDDERSSMQSAQKNNTQQTQNNLNIQEFQQVQRENIHIQDDNQTLQSSAGSLFVSPRGKIEEELKMPVSYKTQSYQGEVVMGLKQIDHNQRDSAEMSQEDRSQKFISSQLTGLAPSQSHGITSNNKLTNTQPKKQQQQQLNKPDQNLIVNNIETPKELGQEQAQQNAQNQQSSNRDFLNTLISNEVYKYSYYEELHQRLEFLKFLVGNCPQILTSSQLQVLWECLVINAFFERERDQFFSWCSSILKAAQSLPAAKEIDAAGGVNIFKDDCLEMLFFDTLLKLDFRYISEIMYECFERYFIYINEQYGQIVTNSAFESAFEVFETKLIGVEALWEITLCARNDKVYKKATEFLHKLYKKMSPSLRDKLNEIKEDLLNTCMEQIKTGYHDIRTEIGSNDNYDIPIYQYSASIEDPKNRIARSISQLCKFIDEFEGLREKGAKSQFGAQEREIQIIGNNQIKDPQPKKIQLQRPVNTKIGSLREEFAGALNPKRNPKEISLMFAGKELNEDMKTLKDIGVGNKEQINVFISLRNQFEMDEQMKQDNNETNELLEGALVQLKEFFGDIDLPKPVLKLALQKTNMNLEETILMITDEDKVNDLQDEVRRNEEAQANNNIVMIEEAKGGEEPDKEQESKLNLIISNRKDHFELLFELLNLGINEVTNAAWNLLIQIPVNKELLQQIRTLNTIQQATGNNWSQIIDSTNPYKMLYSMQIVNSLISVNNEKLSEAEIQERYEWRLRFLELGGFDHLYSILITSEVDDFLGSSQSQVQSRLTGSTGKRKLKSRRLQLQSHNDKKEQQQIQNNSAKCLGYLISIVKIFIQAALITTDEEKLLTLIVQSSTSPYRKPKTINALQSVPQSNKFNQLVFGGSTSQGNNQNQLDSSKDDNSSIYTPKFQSSNSSTPQGAQTPKETQNEGKQGQQMNKSVDTFKADTVYSQQTFSKPNDQLYTQVDDFPRLVEQISGPIAQNLLEKVVNFNGLISKLLNIIYKAVMFCDSPEVSQLVQNSLDLLLPCVVWKPQQLLKEIYEFENLESLLIRTLMYNSNENVRRSLERTFKIICSDSSDIKQNDIESPKVYILKLLLKNLPDNNQQSDQCEEFFNLLTYLMKQCAVNFKIIAGVKFDSINQIKSHIIQEDSTFSAIALFEWCIQQLKDRPTYEDKYSTYNDKILAGYLQLTQSVLEINSELKKSTSKTGYNLVKTVFDFLFLLPSMEDQQSKHQRYNHNNHQVITDPHPKCKKKFTRKKAFNLLLTLCHQCEENFIELLQQLYQFHAQIQKSQKVVNLSEFDNEVGMRSSTGFVGLKNFGCTCYMNALIQQLFMIHEFRKGILEADISQDTDYDTDVLYQLKLIFANLQESEKQYYAPLGFTKAFKFFGEPINVRVQQDTFEFMSALCSNVEELLKGTPLQNFLKDTVGGVIGNETKSLDKDFPYVGEREEDFVALSLDIKNKKNLGEALDLYIKPDFLEGDNQYLCEKYNKKVDAQRRSYLKKLSNTVIINLKRFEFDYNTMQRFKVNDYCEFPLNINFKPWTKEGIREREQAMAKDDQSKQRQSAGERNGADDNAMEDGEEQFNENIEENNGVASAHPGVGSNNSDDENEQMIDIDESDDEEIKKGGEAIDEGMESGEEESAVNTGAYFDDGVEDVIDMVGDDEDMGQSDKKGTNKKRKTRNQNKEEEKQVSQEKQQKKILKKKQKKDDRYYEYELVGVLVHSGSADAGHYYSFIKDRASGKWLEFNDTYVRDFELKNLETECFGGNNDRGPSAQVLLDDFNPADGRYFERCRNAYLLFYERVNPIPPNGTLQQQQAIQNKKLINGIESTVYQRIWEENAAFMKLKIFFDQEYFSFARDYVNLYSFDNVLYFNQEYSNCYKSKHLIELSDQYIKEQTEDLSQDYKAKQQQIESESKKSGDCDIYQGVDVEKIQSDPGLYTLKLATILSQDIITKVKDVQNFVQWMQLLSSLFERHAVACVWFIKYLTDNRNILEELLLESQYFEVRESFAKLLTIAINYDEIYDFDVDQQSIRTRNLSIVKASKAAIIRFMDVFFSQMIDTVRVHWRRFEEYFQVLYSFAQIGYPETKFLIQQKAIHKLLEFIMNCTGPYFSTIKLKMGDRMQEPNFTFPIDILSYLVRSCITPGIQNVREYSPVQIYQQEDTITIPIDEINPFMTKECFYSFIYNKSAPNNDSILNMILHLAWGDLEHSKFFIEEIIQGINSRRNISDVNNHYKVLCGILQINDENQLERLKIAFKFEGFPYSAQQSFFYHLDQWKRNYPLYTIKGLNYIGELALKDQHVLDYLQQYKDSYRDWVQLFILNVNKQAYAIQEAQQNQANLNAIVSACINQYSVIFGESLLQYQQTDFIDIDTYGDVNQARNPQESIQRVNDDLIAGEDFNNVQMVFDANSNAFMKNEDDEMFDFEERPDDDKLSNKADADSDEDALLQQLDSQGAGMGSSHQQFDDEPY